MILCVSKINVNKAWIQAKIHAEPASQKSFANQWCRMPTWHGEWRHREISYTNYWTVHSSAGMQWPLQPASLPYCPILQRWIHYLHWSSLQSPIISTSLIRSTRLAPCILCGPIFICSQNLEQSRVDMKSQYVTTVRCIPAPECAVHLYRSVRVGLQIGKKSPA